MCWEQLLSPHLFNAMALDSGGLVALKEHLPTLKKTIGVTFSVSEAAHVDLEVRKN